jgi:hypothetical protein
MAWPTSELTLAGTAYLSEHVQFVWTVYLPNAVSCTSGCHVIIVAAFM